ncbi:unnamed protein product [Colias eurytheme]|nr:unnamed protein product [Colias eurytheme]
MKNRNRNVNGTSIDIPGVQGGSETPASGHLERERQGIVSKGDPANHRVPTVAAHKAVEPVTDEYQHHDT